jgi:hypothetical protein
MRRSLVLGDETARHPFLQTLPPHVRSGSVVVIHRQTPARAKGKGAPHPFRTALPTRRRSPLAHVTAGDVRQFMLAYCACFLAVSTFIW